MNAFAVAAVIIAVIHLVAAAQRPRLAVIVSGVLWLLYAYYEHLIATGVLCEKDCNIRVDLVFFIPVLALASFCAYRSYMGRPGQTKIIVTVLGIIALFVVGLMVEGRGYGILGMVVFVLGALAFGVYAVKSRSGTKQT